MVAGHVLVVAVAVLVDPPAELPEVVRLAPQVHLAAALQCNGERDERPVVLKSLRFGHSSSIKFPTHPIHPFPIAH